MLNKVIEILDANSEETRHPQWGVVRLFTEDAILAAAEQILTLLQQNDAGQPQLQQTPCKTLLPLTQEQLNELKTIAEGYTYMTDLDETTIGTGGIIEIIKQAESYKRQ